MKLSIPGFTTTFFLPIDPPAWWEGHIIAYKVYPDGPDTTGAITHNLCAIDGGAQQTPPVMPGDIIDLELPDGLLIPARIGRVDVIRVGWPNHFEPGDPECPAQWEISACVGEPISSGAP